MNVPIIKRVMFALFGLALGIGLCVWLVARAGIGSGDWLALAQSLSPMGCLGVLALSALLMLCGAKKWAILSVALHGPKGQEPAPGFFLRHYLWQNWIAQFVPPSLAIILGRGWAARRMPDLPMRSGLYNGLADQAMEFALLMAFLPGSLWVLGGGGAAALIVGAGVGVAALALIVRLGKRFMPDGLREALWPLFGWSLARAALTVLRLVVGVQALGLFLSEVKVAAAAPLVSVLALIPLTPGNLGLAEWGWQGALVFMGQGAIAAALYAVGFRVLVIIAQTILLGGYEAHVAWFAKRD